MILFGRTRHDWSQRGGNASTSRVIAFGAEAWRLKQLLSLWKNGKITSMPNFCKHFMLRILRQQSYQWRPYIACRGQKTLGWENVNTTVQSVVREQLLAGRSATTQRCHTSPLYAVTLWATCTTPKTQSSNHPWMQFDWLADRQNSTEELLTPYGEPGCVMPRSCLQDSTFRWEGLRKAQQLKIAAILKVNGNSKRQVTTYKIQLEIKR